MKHVQQGDIRDMSGKSSDIKSLVVAVSESSINMLTLRGEELGWTCALHQCRCS